MFHRVSIGEYTVEVYTHQWPRSGESVRAFIRRAGFSQRWFFSIEHVPSHTYLHSKCNARSYPTRRRALARARREVKFLQHLRQVERNEGYNKRMTILAAYARLLGVSTKTVLR